MLATRAVTSLAEARAIIDRSFPTEVFEPDSSQPWDREAQRFQQYCEWRGPQRDSRVGVP
jgi:hypothetical protein